MLQVPINRMTFLVFVALLALEDFRGEVNRLGFTTGEMNWLCREADNRQQENRKQRSRASHLTRSRPNYSAIKGGKIRPNTLALIMKAGKNGVHERDFIASADGRQTKTARSS